MNSNHYIFYFDYKSKTIVDNTVYVDLETVEKKAIQIGRAFDPSGRILKPEPNPRSLVYTSTTIDVYILKLIFP
jgi:hypothetical protein